MAHPIKPDKGSRSTSPPILSAVYRRYLADQRQEVLRVLAAHPDLEPLSWPFPVEIGPNTHRPMLRLYVGEVEA